MKTIRKRSRKKNKAIQKHQKDKKGEKKTY